MLGRALVVVPLLASTASADTRWSITFPPEWRDNTAEVNASPPVQGLIERIERAGAKMTITSRESATGEIALVAFTTRPGGSWADLREAEDGARRGANAGKPELAYRRSDGPRVAQIEQEVQYPEMVKHVRLLTGRTPSGEVRMANAECFGEASVCSPILASLRLDDRELADRPQQGTPAATARPRDARSSAERGGEIGAAIGGLVGGVLLVWLLIRVRRQRRVAP